MSKSSINGYSLEYSIIAIFNILELNNDNKKISSLKKQFNKLELNEKMLFLNKGLKIINYFINTFDDIIDIKFSSPNDGKNNSSADLFIILKNKTIPISLKNNNISIKHQRPNKFYSHCRLDKTHEIALIYINKYNEINNKLYLKYKKYKLFSNIKNKEIIYYPFILLIKNFIKYYYKYLNFDNLLNFIFGENNNIIITSLKNNILIYKFNKIEKICKIKIYEIKYNSLQIDFLSKNKKYTIKMRIHNASSKITNKLSLKLDTTYLNIKDNIDIIKI